MVFPPSRSPYSLSLGCAPDSTHCIGCPGNYSSRSVAYGCWPEIVGLVAADSAVNSSYGISVGDTLSVYFAGPTNRPPWGLSYVFGPGCRTSPTIHFRLPFLVTSGSWWWVTLLAVTLPPIFASRVLNTSDVALVLSLYTSFPGSNVYAPASLGVVNGTWTANSSVLVITVVSLANASSVDRTAVGTRRSCAISPIVIPRPPLSSWCGVPPATAFVSMLAFELVSSASCNSVREHVGRCVFVLWAGRLHVAIAGTGNLRNMEQTSQAAYSDGTPAPKMKLTAGTWGNWPAPRIVRVEVFDISATVGIDVKDVIRVVFDQATNGAASTVFSTVPPTVTVETAVSALFTIASGNLTDLDPSNVLYTGLWDQVGVVP